MVSYPLSDGTPFYFPARKQDVQNHRQGSPRTVDPLSRSGQFPHRDDELDRDQVVEMENVTFIRKPIHVICPLANTVKLAI